MSIQKPPKRSTAAEDFIAGAPDAQRPTAAPQVVAPTNYTATTRKRIMKGDKEQISVTMPPQMVDRIEVERKKIGVTRSGYMNMVFAKHFQELDSQH